MLHAATRAWKSAVAAIACPFTATKFPPSLSSSPTASLTSAIWIPRAMPQQSHSDDAFAADSRTGLALVVSILSSSDASQGTGTASKCFAAGHLA